MPETALSISPAHHRNRLALPDGTVNGTLSGSGNLVGVNPLLDPNGLQNNGGPTQTIALQAGSPAIGQGANPENLFADQRGYDPRTGPGGTDIGAYQTNAQADTQAPTAALQADRGDRCQCLRPQSLHVHDHLLG